MTALRLLVAMLGLGNDLRFLLQEARANLTGYPQGTHQCAGCPAELADRQVWVFPPATSDGP